VNAWWEAAGVPFGALAAWGLEYYVKASSLDWVSSARFGDTVVVDAELEKLGRSSLTVVFTVRVGERVCCTVRTTYVATADGRPAPWPDEVRARLGAG
jgi:acyl-CoA thioester hydrolase